MTTFIIGMPTNVFPIEVKLKIYKVFVICCSSVTSSAETRIEMIKKVGNNPTINDHKNAKSDSCLLVFKISFSYFYLFSSSERCYLLFIIVTFTYRLRLFFL